MIEKKYPSYSVGCDRNETLVVDIPDQTGGKYRYQRGAKSSTGLTKKTIHDDKEDAKEELSEMLAKQNMKKDERVLVHGHVRGRGQMPRQQVLLALAPPLVLALRVQVQVPLRFSGG